MFETDARGFFVFLCAVSLTATMTHLLCNREAVLLLRGESDLVDVQTFVCTDSHTLFIVANQRSPPRMRLFARAAVEGIFALPDTPDHCP